MAVLHKNYKSNYTVINTDIFKSVLSLKARGLLCTMLSLPEGWKFTEKGMQTILPKDGQNSLRTAIKELEEQHYLQRSRLRDDKGHLTDVIWNISDYPNLPQPNLENPNLESEPQLNIKELNIKKENINQSITEGTFPTSGAARKKAVPSSLATSYTPDAMIKDVMKKYAIPLVEAKDMVARGLA